ncbi:MAG TPA: hypothetical protein VGN04_10015 [Herbaspirillum sp.]|jgi:hypothetical protein
MTTPDNKKNLLFAICCALPLLLLPGAASADDFEISCRELNAGPDKNLPAPYKAVWDGSILTQIAADSNGKISHSSERVVAARRLPMPNGKGLKYSFVTGIHKTTKNRFLANISAEPTGNPTDSSDFIVSVSYATVDSEGFLIYAFEVVNEQCTLSGSATEPDGNPPNDAGGGATGTAPAPEDASLLSP